MSQIWNFIEILQTQKKHPWMMTGFGEKCMHQARYLADELQNIFGQSKFTRVNFKVGISKLDFKIIWLLFDPLR